jgi:CheY-like chemotaxis protein
MMNLLTNASDALGDESGHIKVRTERVRELDARWDRALGAAARPANWILIEVEDSGIGMDAATRERVFEPFFSTKKKGHGLGLAACLGIVSAHGGAILVDSEPGKGSRFSLILPASERASADPEKRVTPPAVVPCRVLIVDDEELVRSYLKRSLERRGYTVVEAFDGRAALSELSRGEVDVMVLDMTMPDVDGAEVVRRVRASGSSLPIVVSSGYLDADVERRLDRSMFQSLLVKPYGIAELVDAIESARARV